MKANRKFTKNDEAVSPVIGVILMVAITVILAAVIAAFVFGMGGSLQKQYVVAATATQINDTHVDITYMGGPDHNLVTGLSYNVASTTETNDSAISVGYTQSVDGASSERDHVIVSATFTDGAQQVILDTFV